MNFKKKVSGSWTDVPHYVSGTGTDTITTLPATIYPLGQSATLGLKGNTTQNGTPTPANPVMPQGTGDKTANLLNPDSKTTNQYGDERYGGSFPAGTYYILNNSNTTIYYRDGISSTTGNNIEPNNSVVVTTNNELVVWHTNYDTDIMVASSSTALPYEPYGIKIPISSASTTTPVYLGEVQSVRNIAKYVFTGQETWVKSSQAFYTDIIDSFAKSNTLPVCSHFDSSFSDGICVTSGNKRLKLFESALPTGITTAAEVQQYMLTQYDNGTPVCIWYVLASETTGIVNEPLMKIGDYADTLSGVSIPTVAGANTLDVDTTVKPSEVTANYSGWHPVSAVHERESGSWN